MTKDWQKPGWVIFALGIILPVVALVFEIATDMSSDMFFDPIPTIFHVAVIAIVPVSNFIVFLRLRKDEFTRLPHYLCLLNATSIAIATYYTLIYIVMMPIGLFGLVFYGLGLLPLSPAFALYSAWFLRRQLKHKIANATHSGTAQVDTPKTSSASMFRFQVRKTVLVVFMVLFAIDIPNTASIVGLKMTVSKNAEDHKTGLQLIQSIGSINTLVRRAHAQGSMHTGMLSGIVSFYESDQFVSKAQAARVLYQATGKSYLEFEKPRTSNDIFRFDFDDKLAGDEVGGVFNDLQLVSSTVDADIKVEQGYTYTEWTFEVKNNSYRQREARFQLGLPQGAVVSRVTLWVNGEPKEAAFARTSRVKQAYQSVVRRRLDPFLVTTSGPQRVMLQAFPVPPKGGVMKFKVGITSPLDYVDANNATLILPKLLDHNFAMSQSSTQAFWLESEVPFKLNNMQATPVTKDLYRISEQVSNTFAFQNAHTLHMQTGINTDLTLHIGMGGNLVTQQLVKREVAPKSAVAVVIDGSSSIEPHLPAILTALKSIPYGQTVAILVATETLHNTGFVEWDNKQLDKVAALFDSLNTRGGFDNAPALTQALMLLESENNGELLWIHGIQPITFNATSAALSQAENRLKTLPSVSVYSFNSSINRLFSDPNLFSMATQINKTDNIQADLHRYFNQIMRPNTQWKMQRVLIEQDANELSTVVLPSNGKWSHQARLWAYQKVLQLLNENQYEKAGALAAEFQLVTPVSGAVVLETKQQYEDNDLSPAEKTTVPHINAPGTALFIVGGIILLFASRKRVSRSY